MRSEAKPSVFYGWYVLAATTFVVCMSFGTSTSIGVFFKPIVEEFKWLRADLSLGISIGYVLFALSCPFIGRVVDGWGVRRVFLAGILILAAGNALMSLTTRLWQMYVFYGVLVALGASASTFVPTSAVVVRWFRRRRGLALSIANSGGALGMLLVVYLSAFLIQRLGWRRAFLVGSGVLVLTTLPLVLAVVRNDPADVGSRPDGETGEEPAAPGTGPSARTAKDLSRLPWRRAMATSPFWLISGGYFTCGFSVTLFSVHIVPYATDLGFSFQTAAAAVAFSGFFNVLGTLTAGVVSDRLGRKNPLAVTYFVRGLSFVIFLLWQNLLTLYLFAAVIGFSYFATVPLTAGLTGDIYGPRNMGVLYGTITGVHQIGSAVGAYVGGRVFDLTGTYQGAFLMAVALLLAASFLSYWVQEARYRELVPAGG